MIMCDACTNAQGKVVNAAQAISDRRNAMHGSDWTALLLASIVVAFGVFGEVRDAMMCEFAIAAIRERSEVPGGWRYAMGLLNLLRLFGFLPFILGSVVKLVVFRGGSALAICLNTVAVLFLVELDNLAFSHGLREKMRVEAEEFGRISVTDDDSRLIDVIKLVCMLTVPAAILGGVAAADYGFIFAVLPVPLVVMVQSVLRAPAGKCVGACWGLLRVLVGFFVAGCVMAVGSSMRPGIYRTMTSDTY